MKVKQVTYIDIPCPSCGEMDVKYRAHGVCWNCYFRMYRKNKKGDVDNSEGELKKN